ncbi:MAG: M1 family metallopeptidase, partial [Planctomycetota bacterium]
MAGLCQTSYGQPFPNRKYGQEDKFRQLEEILPTPNSYRSASGEPGPDYWQQRVDYTIDVRLDESDHSIHGSETIRYRNQSPHTLRYLWVQLDPNIFAQDSDANRTRSGRIGFGNRASMAELDSILERTQRFDGRCMIESVTDALGKGLDIFTVDTMMRIDLPEPLLSGQEFSLKIQWSYVINNSKLIGGRTGYEPFEKDGNAIYEIAQWFPRLAAFTDVTGWQHKQYLGQGEFTLEFGDYLVRITAPADHIVAATGELQNPNEVLSDVQRERLEQARTADRPVLIVTPEEAKENEKEKTDQLKTWIFRAEAVRDFAFATSRKFIWDAQGHRVNDNSVMAMSYYPNEGNPLWSKYSTHAIIHTLNVYSRYTFDYPYPVAISVNGPVGGMEYPMICFNGPRPKEDGTYSASTKYDLITVIIHEVGHNYFPMIVNSDERQWSWMDEGLNTFLQYLAEQEWEQDYPSQRGEPELIVPYMQSTNQVP